jgi:hypothetical protein
MPTLAPGEKQDDWADIAREPLETITEKDVEFEEFPNYDWSKDGEKFDLENIENFLKRCKE